MSNQYSNKSAFLYIIFSIVLIIIGYFSISYISTLLNNNYNNHIIHNINSNEYYKNILTSQEPAVFGKILGWTSTIVPTPAFSCDYKTSTLPGYYMNSTAYSNYIILTKNSQNIYTGIKWQCVEFSRRFLILNYGITYESVDYAYDIFSLKYGINVFDNSHVQIQTFRNGNINRPQLGDLLIWNKTDDVITGHVAVVLDVSDTYVHLAEQNYDDYVWPEGQKYARSLACVVDNNNNFFIINDPSFLGWVRFGSSVAAA